MTARARRARARHVVVTVVALAGAIAPVPAAAAAPSVDWPFAPESLAAAAGTGGVAINGSAAATASSDVVVTVPPPTNTYGVLRLSNDAGTTWAERPRATSVAWSLTADAGGVDADGSKTVTVEAGDGEGTWAPVGSASILLDRTGPVVSAPYADSDSVVTTVHLDATDEGVGLARTEVSLDGLHWRQLSPTPFSFYPPGTVDVREGTIGGNWDPGPRTVHTRAVDKLGNITVANALTITPTTMRYDGDPPATFAFPLPAIAGQTYTIAPTFESGYHLAAGQFCQWHLKWGSEPVRLEAAYDETYGEVVTSVSPTNGVCAPWTFTLPFTPPLEYSWTLTINNHPTENEYWTSALAGSFRAQPGSTSRAITSSNLPLYYLLPDDQIVGLGGQVTYHLKTAGGAVAASGSWSCFPAAAGPENLHYEQTGGTTFTCPVSTSEPWTAFWAREANNRLWRAGYDPVGDRSRPVVASLRATPAAGSWLTTSTQIKLTWSGKDSGSGISRYRLQVSRNGGAYTDVALPSPRATSLVRSATVGATYRYRIRAVDRAGNVGDWTYTPTFRPAGIDATSGSASWSAGWWIDVETDGAVGGFVREAGHAGAAMSFRFTGQSIGLLAPHWPGSGWSRIYVDGTLVATVNLYGSSITAPRVVWSRSWASAGTHTVRLVNLGTAGTPMAAVDAFVVLR